MNGDTGIGAYIGGRGSRGFGESRGETLENE